MQHQPPASVREATTSITPWWSGVPIVLTDVMIVPLHVTDERAVLRDAEWRHVGFFESQGGDIEYHIYRRD